MGMGTHEMRSFSDLTKPNPPEYLLALDPGGTTGIAAFRNGGLVTYTQIKDFTPGTLDNFLTRQHRALGTAAANMEVVCEDYRVYQTHTAQHANSSLLTVRLLGALESWTERHHTPLHLQMAGQAKPFSTDRKLQEWGMYIAGQPHATDAIRHGVYYLIFRRPQPPNPKQHTSTPTHRVG